MHIAGISSIRNFKQQNISKLKNSKQAFGSLLNPILIDVPSSVIDTLETGITARFYKEIKDVTVLIKVTPRHEVITKNNNERQVFTIPEEFFQYSLRRGKPVKTTENLNGMSVDVEYIPYNSLQPITSLQNQNQNQNQNAIPASYFHPAMISSKNISCNTNTNTNTNTNNTEIQKSIVQILDSEGITLKTSDKLVEKYKGIYAPDEPIHPETMTYDSLDKDKIDKIEKYSDDKVKHGFIVRMKDGTEYIFLINRDPQKEKVYPIITGSYLWWKKENVQEPIFEIRAKSYSNNNKSTKKKSNTTQTNKEYYELKNSTLVNKDIQLVDIKCYNLDTVIFTYKPSNSKTNTIREEFYRKTGTLKQISVRNTDKSGTKVYEFDINGNLINKKGK